MKDIIEDINKNFKDYNEDCNICSLYNRPYVGNEVIKNKESNDIDILFIGEAPGKDEVMLQRPFIGRAGQLLRKAINKLKDFNIVITNVCHCHPENNRTPTEEEIKYCGNILSTVIDKCDPRLIIVLGSTAFKAIFGKFDNIKISDYIGKITESNNRKILSCYHPAYIIRNKTKEDWYINEMIDNVNNFFKKKYKKDKYLIDNFEGIILDDINFYTDCSLIDVQDLENKILYIFSRNNKKLYHTIDKGKNYYFYISKTGKVVLNKNNAYIVKAPLTNTVKEKIYNKGYFIYDDHPIITKAIIDYYRACDSLGIEKGLPEIDYTIVDIEVFNEKEFPKPELANYPVVIASCFYSRENKIKCFYYDEKNRNIDNEEIFNNEYNYNIELIKCNDEIELIEKVVRSVKPYNLITAWNIYFDIVYLYFRYKKLVGKKKCDELFSDIENIPGKYIPGKKSNRGIIFFPGLIVLDLLDAYKKVVVGNPEKSGIENFSLDYIANYELGRGKFEKSRNFNSLFSDSLTYSIKYNIIDVILVNEINNKLKIINFFNELRFIFRTTFNNVFFNTHLLDAALRNFCLSKNLLVWAKQYAFKEVEGEAENISPLGAYVHTPHKGFFPVVQFDFSGLYPNIIISFNLGNNSYIGIIEDEKALLFINYYFCDRDPKYDHETLILRTADNLTRMVSFSRLADIIDKKGYLAFNGSIYLRNKESIFKEILLYFRKKRKYYKDLYKETKNEEYYLKQHCYKIAANSLYGFIGYKYSRFVNQAIVEAVTLTGQILNKTISLLVENYRGDSVPDVNLFRETLSKVLLNYYKTETEIENRKRVVYGDTDSIFINIPEVYDDLASKLDYANNLLAYLNESIKIFETQILNNKENNLGLELKYIGNALFRGKKKRYIVYCEYPNKKTDIKGFEIRRSDYPKYFKKACSNLIDLIGRKSKLDEIKEFVVNIDKDYHDKLSKIDLEVGKPVSWNKEYYTSLTPAIKGMMFFNIFFWETFYEGSKGSLFSLDIDYQNIPEEYSQLFLKYLEKINEKGKVKRESLKQELKKSYITFPYDLSEEDIIKINLFFNENPWIRLKSEIKTLWHDRVKDLIDLDVENL